MSCAYKNNYKTQENEWYSYVHSHNIYYYHIKMKFFPIKYIFMPNLMLPYPIRVCKFSWNSQWISIKRIVKKLMYYIVYDMSAIYRITDNCWIMFADMGYSWTGEVSCATYTFLSGLGHLPALLCDGWSR